jgi:hypothetical protein
MYLRLEGRIPDQEFVAQDPEAPQIHLRKGSAVTTHSPGVVKAVIVPGMRTRIEYLVVVVAALNHLRWKIVERPTKRRAPWRKQ